MSSEETQVVYISKTGQMSLISLGLRRKWRQDLQVTIMLSLVIQRFPLSFLCFSWMLRFKHSTYHSHFLRFIASTSGLEALHLSRSITLQHALAQLLSLCPTLSLALLPFLHLFAPLPLCLPVPTPAPPFSAGLVNYLLYFVSELMSDIKRRMELDSKYKNGFLSVVLDNNYDLPVKPRLQQRDCSLKQRLWCKKCIYSPL